LTAVTTLTIRVTSSIGGSVTIPSLPTTAYITVLKLN
jgi:hypothetical protein